MIATVVTNVDELNQIVQLSQKNLRAHISDAEQSANGFVTWNYSLELLQQMNAQQPHIIAKDNNKVIGYALVALKEAARFHRDLYSMVHYLEAITYNNKKLAEFKYYVMGQICIDQAYRGKGIFQMLYQQHRILFEKHFDFVITEISTSNNRSLHAHKNIGFKIIHTYKDVLDEWNVVLWDWI